MRHGDDQERVVQSVTSAPASGSDDQAHRVKRYLLTMGIRVVCGALALFTEGWLRWTFVALAVVLPYIALAMTTADHDPDARPFVGHRRDRVQFEAHCTPDPTAVGLARATPPTACVAAR